VGAALRRARELAELSQSELGRQAAMAANVISRIESDERPFPAFATIARLAEPLGLSLDQLAAECGLLTKKREGRAPALASVTAELNGLRKDLQRLVDRFEALVARLEEESPARTPRRRR